MKVACIQLSTGENYEKNLKKILILYKKCISKGADFILTPETSSIMSDDKKKLKEIVHSMKLDSLIRETKKICLKYKKWILIGSLAIKDRVDLRNRSVLIGPSGKVKCYYDKINMFDVKISKRENHKESKTFKPGKKIVTVKLPWGRLGLTICYDLRFPELYRNLSKKNLSFISVPSAFTKITGQRHWHTLLKARAIENFCYIFAPAQTGRNTKKRETYGHTLIISPDGKILKEKKKGEGIIMTRINPKLSMKLRKIIPSFN